MANNLKDHLKEVADAIRAKKGTNDLINPQDFATEIEGISGGGESGEWVYCNSELWNSTAKSILPLYASLAKGSVDLGNGAMQVVLTPLMLSSYGATSISAYAFNLSAQMANPSMQYTIKEAMIADAVYDIIKQTEITKEQFYDLNA